MLLSEPVRDLSYETIKLSDITEYTYTGTSWGTVRDHGDLILPEVTLVTFKFSARRTAGSGVVHCRLKIGSLYAWGRAGLNSATAVSEAGAVWLAAGTYDVIMEGLVGSGNTLGVSAFAIGVAKISDLVGNALQSYSGAINNTVSARRTLLGDLSRHVIAVQVHAYTPTGQTNLENPGDSLTNGVSVSVDGVQVSWDTRNQDGGSYGTCSGRAYIGGFAVGSSHSVTIAKDNANTVVHISVLMTPWILASTTTHKPIILDIPQGSTLYLVSEPFLADNIKTTQTGKTRVVSFGSADFYSTASGTAILTFSYTFEVVNVNVELFAYGYGGCITFLGVDMR